MFSLIIPAFTSKTPAYSLWSDLVNLSVSESEPGSSSRSRERNSNVGEFRNFSLPRSGSSAPLLQAHSNCLSKAIQISLVLGEAESIIDPESLIVLLVAQ